MKLVAMIVMVAIAACAQPDVSASDAGTGEVAQADTVCGLPDTCSVVSCAVLQAPGGGTYLDCQYDAFGDVGCQISCGSFYARCNSNFDEIESCGAKCAAQGYIEGSDLDNYCTAGCVNNIRHTCVFGLEP